MKSQLLEERDEKTYVVALDAGEEVVASLMAFAKAHDLGTSHISAVGAFSEVLLGFWDVERNHYRRIPVKEQVEVLSLMGDILVDDDEPSVNANVVVGNRDGHAFGGHLVEGYVRPGLEVIIVESSSHLHRIIDPKSGYARIGL